MGDLHEQWVRAIRAGDFAAAWALSDRALALRDPATRDDPAHPYHLRWVWDGRGFDGADVLVRCYHGLGDTLHYARYLPLLAERAAGVTLEVQPELAGLLAQLPGLSRIVPFDPARPLPPSTCDIEITELPHALRVSPHTAPPPYLSASPAALPAGTIGLCHTAGDWDPARRIPAELLVPICAARPCLALVPQPSGLPVLNPDGCSTDIAETASLIAGCSLVVTVDTMVAHLAGALGRPTWLLLKAAPDWRWPAQGTETSWYPSMRIYTQPHPGAWPDVVARVRRDLAAAEAETQGLQRA